MSWSVPFLFSVFVSVTRRKHMMVQRATMNTDSFTGRCLDCESSGNEKEKTKQKQKQLAHLKPIWFMWSVSRSIFQSRQRKSGGEPCMEKCVMISFSLVMDFHFLYSSSTFFFRLKRLSWGTLFCLKNACARTKGTIPTAIFSVIVSHCGLQRRILKKTTTKHCALFTSVEKCKKAKGPSSYARDWILFHVFL